MATAVLSIFSKALGFLPQVGPIVALAEGTVKLVEDALHHKNGATKKAAALSIINTLLTGFADAESVSAKVPQVDTIALQSICARLVDDVVAFYNLVGAFRHQSAPPAPAK